MSINNIAVTDVLMRFTGISNTIPKKQIDKRKTEAIRINQNDFVYLKSNQNKSEINLPCIIYAKVSQKIK
jgi:hypothetical protein